MKRSVLFAFAVVLALGGAACVAPTEKADGEGDGVAKSESEIAYSYWGFWHTPQTGPSVTLASWSDYNPYYCWVVDPGELSAIAIQNHWDKGVGTVDLSTLAYGRPGSSGTFCPWPNGMFVVDGAVYLVQGATRTSQGTSCHVISNEQVAHHGGWGLVWQPGLPAWQMNFKLASAYKGDCAW
jgi:hypothetical protein